ncbi:MAG TPA: polysaccharide deacetylase family protein [Rhizobiaceae bacterium]|nr:polysaccharide deacetylase family protein [Rhizobiaceae bacterium]
MSAFAEVEAELQLWREHGLTPRFWLRDDDAARPSAELERLIAAIREFDVPLLLAVIPMLADAELAERLRPEPLVTPCVHGYAHQRQNAGPAPAIELGGDRSPDVVLAELSAGRERLRQLFGDRLSGILVPPWNRIAPDVAARIHERGFTGLSTNSWHVNGTLLPELNTQIDIVDWANGRQGHSLEWAAGELLRRLWQARERGGAPLGILTHHLVMDDQAWRILRDLILYLKVKKGFAFEAADDLLASSVKRLQD